MPRDSWPAGQADDADEGEAGEGGGGKEAGKEAQTEVSVLQLP